MLFQKAKLELAAWHVTFRTALRAKTLFSNIVQERGGVGDPADEI